MKVRKYLNTFSIDKLVEEFGIKVNYYDDFMVLNYSMIDSPKINDITIECRSLILENRSPYNIISRSFDRFFNSHENDTYKTFDLTKAVVWEKMDGSIITFYNYEGQWYASTRKMAMAEAALNLHDDYTFNDIINMVDFDRSIFNEFDNELCYICELTSPYNRIVKKYEKPELTLLGIRHRVTGKEFNFDELIVASKELNIKLPKYYQFNSLDEIIQSFKHIDPTDEGYVCAIYEDDKVFRMKVKNPAYLAIAAKRGDGTIAKKDIVNLIMACDYDEYLSIFPEDKIYFDPWIKSYELMIEDIEALYNKYNHIKDQKEFALAIMNSPSKNILFSLRKGIAMDEIFSRMHDNAKINILRQYKKE